MNWATDTATPKMSRNRKVPAKNKRGVWTKAMAPNITEAAALTNTAEMKVFVSLCCLTREGPARLVIIADTFRAQTTIEATVELRCLFSVASNGKKGPIVEKITPEKVKKDRPRSNENILRDEESIWVECRDTLTQIKRSKKFP